MFFESEHFTARIFLVQRFSWEKSSNHVMARPFSALALRVRGEGSFCFADETRLTSRAGDVLYLPHGVGYEVDYSAGEVIVFHFWESGEAMKAQNFTPRDIADLTALFGEACRCFAQDTLRSRMEVNALFYRILSALCEEEDDADTATPCRTAVSFLVAGCLDAELSVSSVCARAKISETSFRRKFYAVYGKTPIRFLTELRLREAHGRLISGRESVESIALSCGFHDAKYFSRVFKRCFGYTPAQARTL